MTQVPTNNENRPLHEIRIGFIKAAIWSRDTEYGTQYSTQIARLYKRDGSWQLVSSFSDRDLLVVAKVADLAHSWMNEQRQVASEQPVADVSDAELDRYEIEI